MQTNTPISLKKMSQEEFENTALFSFELFVKELAKSSGKDISEVRKQAGSPPLKRTENDLWRSINLNDTKIGYLWIRIKPEKQEAFGYEIYLFEEYRGQGYGRLTMEEGKKLLREKNIKTLKICVFENNTVARSLYDSLGFKTEKINQELKQHHQYIDI